MKKALYGTTALFAAGALMASPAAAEEKIKLGVGGYWQTVLSWTDQDNVDRVGTGSTNFKEDAVRQEGEIHFTGETTLDNGITFGVNIQLEGVTQSDQIDESYLIVQGSFGRVLVGAENSAPYLMGYIAPSVALGVNSPNFFLFQDVAGNASDLGASVLIPDVSAGTSTVVDFTTSDSNKLTYFTPRFAGFQIGLSYTPNTDEPGGDRQSSGLRTSGDIGDVNRVWSGGINYVNSFGNFDVAVSAGGAYGTNEADGPAETYDDYENYGFGLNLGYAGFTFGGSYYHSNNAIDDDGDTDAFDIGISYETGPWGVSFTYLHSETEIRVDDDENENDHFELGLSYALGPGITAVASGQYRDEDNEVIDDSDGWAFAIGTKLSF